jgi:hypothetical protein
MRRCSPEKDCVRQSGVRQSVFLSLGPAEDFFFIFSSRTTGTGTPSRAGMVKCYNSERVPYNSETAPQAEGGVNSQ